MIPVQDIVDRCKFILDSEGSDRYLFEQDFKPAINSSTEWLVAVFNKAFAEKKLSEENLRDLIFTKVFLASGFSRVDLDKSSIIDSIWSILRVVPNPEVSPAYVPSTEGCDKKSKLMSDLMYLRGENSAKRLTLEEWEENRNNIFEAGNNIITDPSLLTYAYLNIGDYSSTKFNNGKEIEIRPDVSDKLVGITYLKYPGQISSETDQLPFPESLTDLVYQKALNFISFKQGDQTNLYTVTSRDVQVLTQLMV